ncbi:ASCH domain-containing protein [Sphingomonas sp. LaA6.9]|uniref:ASCH domain-containing protein n=1 Tax=Sphingomonas sp. LaA6.9 TaxID=2919914 RepID=UPI001F4FA79D|nr:ASCH domain-containing protein [Sphingomonas sp. LaA6.9]MCJ8158825.1 ASCH domain-containing protein [Sphingomonas sp. LaA6.9]
MKALTIWQPWASLIVAGAKPYEFRGWRAPRVIVGERIVIHAAARAMKPGEIAGILHALRGSDQERAATCLHADKAEGILRGAICEGLPLAAGLGTAVIGEARNGYDIAAEFGLARVNDSDRDAHANWGWPMLEIEQWPTPIEIRGAQGFWNWPDAASAAAQF